MITASQAFQMASHPYEDEISPSLKELLTKWISADAKCGRRKLIINEISLENLEKWQKIAIWLDSYGYKCHFQKNNSIEKISFIISW